MSCLVGEAGKLWTVCYAIAKKLSKAWQFATPGPPMMLAGAGGGRGRQLVQLRQRLVQLKDDDVAAAEETPLFAVSFAVDQSLTGEGRAGQRHGPELAMAQFFHDRPEGYSGEENKPADNDYDTDR